MNKSEAICTDVYSFTKETSQGDSKIEISMQSAES